MKTTGIQSLRKELDQKAIEISNLALQLGLTEDALAAMTQERESFKETCGMLQALVEDLTAKWRQQVGATGDAKNAHRASEQSLAEVYGALEEMKESTLPALRVSLETEILPGIVASAQAWEAQRAERAVRTLIDALPPPAPRRTEEG
jgi:septal ring factor EnvC (AmiA/AmiB activator)